MMTHAISNVSGTPKNAVILGCVGLYIFAFSSMLSTEAGFYTGLILMLTGFLAAGLQPWKTLVRTPIFWVSLTLCLYILAAAFINSREILPDPSFGNTIRKWGDLTAISGMFALLIAWTLQLHPANVSRALALWLLGYLTAVALGGEWSNLSAYLEGRPLFGLRSGFGFYTLCAMVGVLILAYGDRSSRGHSNPVFAVGFSLLLAVLLALFIVGRARGAWLTALAILPFVAAVLYRRRSHAQPTVSTRLVVLSVLIISALMLAWNYELIANRFLEEWDVHSSYWQGGGEGLRLSSTSYRIWLWEEAIERIGERPVFGWGPGTSEPLIAQTETLKHLGHYHNIYLQLTVELGVIGLSLFTAWIYMAIRGARRAYKEGRMSADMALCTASFALIFALVSLVQFRHSEAGQFFMMFMGALVIQYQIDFAPESTAGAENIAGAASEASESNQTSK